MYVQCGTCVKIAECPSPEPGFAQLILPRLVPRRASSLSKQKAQLKEEQLSTLCISVHSDWPVKRSNPPGQAVGPSLPGWKRSFTGVSGAARQVVIEIFASVKNLLNFSRINAPPTD
jgi:hypothetical protein